MNVMTTENVMLDLHGKNQAKCLFFKNPYVATISHMFFLEKKDNNADLTAMVHLKMIVFTINVLLALERKKHCLQWKKIHVSAFLQGAE